MTFSRKKNLKKSLLQQARELILDMIHKDGYTRDDKLPPERELASRFGISRATIARAYSELTKQGFLYQRVGQGTFVVEKGKQELPLPYRVIALFVPNLLNPVFALFSSEFEKEAFKLGYSVVLCQSEKGMKQIEEVYIKHFNETAIDAIAIVSGSKQIQRLIQSTKIPHVFISPVSSSQDMNRIDILPIRTREAVALAANHLISQGHRRIALLGGTKAQNVSMNTLGYLDALNQADIKVDEELMIYEDSVPNLKEMGMELDYRAIGEWLLNKMAKIKNRPTAAVVYNDARAIGVIDAAKKMKISIPQDLALIGLDNNYSGASPDISLSSVDLHYRKIAPLAVRFLRSKLDLKSFNRTLIEKKTAPTLVLRGSSLSTKVL